MMRVRNYPFFENEKCVNDVFNISLYTLENICTQLTAFRKTDPIRSGASSHFSISLQKKLQRNMDCELAAIF